MAINPKKLFKMQMAWKQFNDTHPKVLPFIKAVEAAGIREGTVIEIRVKRRRGRSSKATSRYGSQTWICLRG